MNIQAYPRRQGPSAKCRRDLEPEVGTAAGNHTIATKTAANATTTTVIRRVISTPFLVQGHTVAWLHTLTWQAYNAALVKRFLLIASPMSGST